MKWNFGSLLVCLVLSNDREVCQPWQFLRHPASHERCITLTLTQQDDWWYLIIQSNVQSRRKKTQLFDNKGPSCKGNKRNKVGEPTGVSHPRDGGTAGFTLFSEMCVRVSFFVVCKEPLSIVYFLFHKAKKTLMGMRARVDPVPLSPTAWDNQQLDLTRISVYSSARDLHDSLLPSACDPACCIRMKRKCKNGKQHSK